MITSIAIFFNVLMSLICIPLLKKKVFYILVDSHQVLWNLGHTRYLYPSCYSSLVQLLQHLFFMLMLLSWYFKKCFQTFIFPGNTACDHISPLILLIIFQHNLKVAWVSLNFGLAFASSYKDWLFIFIMICSFF